MFHLRPCSKLQFLSVFKLKPYKNLVVLIQNESSIFIHTVEIVHGPDNNIGNIWGGGGGGGGVRRQKI